MLYKFIVQHLLGQRLVVAAAQVKRTAKRADSGGPYTTTSIGLETNGFRPACQWRHGATEAELSACCTEGGWIVTLRARALDRRDSYN